MNWLSQYPEIYTSNCSISKTDQILTAIPTKDYFPVEQELQKGSCSIPSLQRRSSFNFTNTGVFSSCQSTNTTTTPTNKTNDTTTITTCMSGISPRHDINMQVVAIEIRNIDVIPNTLYSLQLAGNTWTKDNNSLAPLIVVKLHNHEMCWSERVESEILDHSLIISRV